MIDLRRQLALLATLALAACGGGGGGGSSGQAAGGTPSGSNPPPSAPLRIDDTNAAQAADLVFDGLANIIWPTDVLIARSAHLAVPQINRLPLPMVCASGTADTRYLDNDNSGRLSAGDEARVVYDGCSGDDGELSLVISSMTGVIESLRGTVTFDVTRKNGKRYRGSLTVDYSSDPIRKRWSMTAVMLEATWAGAGTQTFTVDAFDVTRFVPFPRDYTSTFNGRVASNLLGGDLTFATETALTGTYGQFPIGGVALVSAASSRARFASVLNVGYPPKDVEIRIDAGNGQFGAPRNADWLSVTSGELFGAMPGAPIIHRFAILPTPATVADTLVASADVSDPNSIFPALTFVWRRNGEVIAGQPGGILPPGQHRKGDVIEVTMTASDGELASTASAQVTIANSPPVIANAGLSPSAPFTYDDLRAAANISDADGDPLEIGYAWQRNAQPVPTVTGNVFAADLHQKNDVVGVRISAHDGETESAAQLSATVKDSPPLVSVQSAPTQLTYGMPTVFQARVADADDEPVAHLRFVIDHGPGGMTVDPSTGAVAWTPNGPLFDRSTQMQWGITVDDPSANVVSGTIEVVDQDREYPLARTGVHAPLLRTRVRVADFDSDGDEEMLVLGVGSLYELKWNGVDYSQSWVSPYAFEATNTGDAMASGDVDGDGYHEIFVTARNKIARLDGRSRRLVATGSIGGSEDRRCAQLELADVNADGAADLVCLIQDPGSFPSGLIVLRAATFEVLAQGPLQNTPDDLIVLGNVDTDPRLEIVIANGAVYDGATLLDDWPGAPRFGSGVGIGDIDGDGVDEIVSVERGFIVNPTLRVFRRGNPTPIATVPNIEDGSVLVQDVDGDSIAEIVVRVGRAAELRVYRYDAGALELDYAMPSPGSYHVTTIASGNVDNDANPEFIWTASFRDSIVIAEGGSVPRVEWTYTDPSHIDGPIIGGELARLAGQRALVFATAKSNDYLGNTRLLALAPTSGELTISEDLGFGTENLVRLTVTDFDHDGTDEVLFTTRDYFGEYFTAYDLPAALAQWQSPRNLTLLTAVAAADMNADGREDAVALANTGRLYVYDIHANTLIWQTTLSQLSGVALSVADLNGDGTKEIVVASNEQVAVYSRASAGPEPFARTALFSSPARVSDVATGDTDGNGRQEVFVITRWQQQPSRTPVYRLDDNLALLGSFTVPIEAEAIYVEELGFSRQNIILPTRDFFGFGPSHVVVFDPDSGKEVWRSPALLNAVSPDSLHFVDVLGNGEIRMALGTRFAMLVTR